MTFRLRPDQTVTADCWGDYVNGHDVNLTLVSEGLAMVYRKASFRDKSAYYETERTAIQQRNGFGVTPRLGRFRINFPAGVDAAYVAQPTRIRSIPPNSLAVFRRF